MDKELVYPEADAWEWKTKVPFARSVVVGDQVFISGQQSLAPDGAVLHAGDMFTL